MEKKPSNEVNISQSTSFREEKRKRVYIFPWVQLVFLGSWIQINYSFIFQKRMLASECSFCNKDILASQTRVTINSKDSKGYVKLY